MATHSSATTREETPHVNKSTKNKTLNGSTTQREETPHVSNSTKQTINNALKRRDVSNSIRQTISKAQTISKGLKRPDVSNSTKRTISNTLKQRAEAVIKDKSIDAESRALIRYGLEVNDPWLPELVRRVEAGETIIETIVLLKHPKLPPTIRMGKKSKR